MQQATPLGDLFAEQAVQHTLPAVPLAEALRVVPTQRAVIPVQKTVAAISQEEQAEERRLRKMLWATATGVALVVAALIVALARG